MSEVEAQERRAVIACIKVAGDDVHVEAQRCAACGAVTTWDPLACPSCGARETLARFRVAETGRLHAYSIVHRSYPGVPTPFVSAIIDLDDGVTLKGVLRGVEARPDAIAFGMPVRMTFDDALGRRDREGRPYVSYVFEPLP